MMKFLTPKQLKEALHMTKSQYDYLNEAGMPHIQIDEKVRFCKKEVVSWLTEYFMQQEQAEADFKDEMDRTIEAYVSIEQIATSFCVKKKVIRTLCTQGMPHEMVGAKPFFLLEAVYDFFQNKNHTEPTPPPLTKVKEEIEETKPAIIEKETTIAQANPMPTAKKSESTLIIVDGSFHDESKTVCAGMVIQHGNEMKGISYVYPKQVNQSIFCEYYAIYQALCYVKEQRLTQVILGSDQKDFVDSLHKEERVYHKWMKNQPYKSFMDGLYTLWDEVKEFVMVVYANVPRFKIQYENAHGLSRYYDDIVMDDLHERMLINSRHITTKPEISPKLSNVSKKGLHIQYHSVDEKYIYFFVSNNGVIKKSKMIISSPIRAALLLAFSYTQFATKKIDIHIGKMPHFDKAIYSHGLNAKSKQKTIDIVERLLEEANVHAEDDVTRYLHALKKQKQIA